MWKPVLKILMTTSALVLGMSLSALGQTSIDRSPEAEAIVIVESAEYRFSGNCLLMGRGNATQLRMTVPGSGPNGEHVYLVLYATTFAPTQFTIYAAPTPEGAQNASSNDDQSAWRVRGGASQEGVEFSPGSLSADMTASVYANGEKVIDETTARLDIAGC